MLVAMVELYPLLANSYGRHVCNAVDILKEDITISHLRYCNAVSVKVDIQDAFGRTPAVPSECYVVLTVASSSAL
ncbi:hypothetical protein ACKVWC_010106 [Pyricularia oryzae]